MADSLVCFIAKIRNYRLTERSRIRGPRACECVFFIVIPDCLISTLVMDFLTDSCNINSILIASSTFVRVSVPGFENGIKGMFDLEVGIFEDPSPAPTMLEVGSRNDNCVAESSGLIPEEWKPVQEGLSRTKKQRRRDALDRLEREAKERQKRNRMLLDNQVVGRKVHMEKSFTRVLPENTTNEGPANDNDSLSRDLLSNEASEVSTLVNQSTSKNPRSVLGNAPAEAMAQTSSSSRLEQQSPVGISTKTVNAKIMSKWNPMHTLAASGQKNRLDLLLRRGGEINAQDVDGFTAMHWAVLRGGARDTIIRTGLLFCIMLHVMLTPLQSSPCFGAMPTSMHVTMKGGLRFI